jgi:hypothetical protein
VACRKSRISGSPRLIALAAVGVLVLSATLPARASAHGPVAPIASSYLARIGHAPAGLDAKVVDGDLLMWLRVRRGLTVVVIDYRGAPYLRFSPAGVFVNENSSMFYLNQSPVALTPPTSLTAGTPPKWHRVNGGNAYRWHDGRLHALASVALAPGASFVGRWRLPLLLDGHRTAITGSLWHADNPSIVWFWPVLVLLACVLAGLRVRRPEVDRGLARTLAIAALIGLSVATVTRELHGRPFVTVLQWLEIVAVLAFAIWALHRVLLVAHGYLLYLAIAIVALWQGAELIPTLLQGFVLATGPPALVRVAAVLSLATGISLLPMVFRVAEARDGPAPGDDRELEQLGAQDDAWELA